MLLLSLLLVLAPGAIFGGIAISSGRRSLTEAVGRQLAEEARNVSDSLAGTLAREFQDLRTFARQDLMREIRIGDLDKRISSFLVSLQREKGAILELRVTDLAGRVVAASDPARIGGEDLVPHSASDGPPQESLRGPVANGTPPVLELTVPIPDPDRSELTIGRLIAFYDWRRATDAADQVRRNLLGMGLEVEVLITDGAAAIIGGALEPTTTTPLGTDLRAAGWTLPLATLRPGASGFVVEPEPGALVGYTRLRDAAPPWTVLVVEPLVRALAPVRAMTIGLGIALVTVLAAALGVAMLLANRITRPLRELTHATERIAGGERSAPVVAIRSRDEVGQLAAAFNQMSVDLRRAESEVLEAAKFAFAGELAAGVAHEVRTTLGVLRSSAQILEPSVAAADAESAELIQIMLQEINSLDEVVTQLLSLGRPRELAIEPRRLAPVVFRAVDFLDTQARSKRITIRRVANDGDPVALCDEEQIYQVALNLVVNAVQVLAPGGEITVVVLGRQGAMVGFEVRDDGPGIPEEIRQKIFLPFVTHREGGTGLGLTLVRRVVQDHRGRLSVDSEVGRGAVFRVELPAAESET